ncbi:glutathione peroxidase [Candidatus Kirkpatrickella diaphorinae]|uniref:Glutathione peroxidase n=1 Tax=Candidatus Kirkpatrickella diaphorinae TaxID=2984322 RepID=A0ABY6GKS6_9PROT|nr:glutathione peroxidase [Candidatus Kirkpatrickella diaphorinae]UYH52145.1 glutathione peroxidase [Candidatus Kirkpatrickella diaphorinae]
MTTTTLDDFYRLELKALDEKTPISFSAFKGKVVLIANTASKCKFTTQYEDLQHLWTLYRTSGLVVVGVPCNDFGQQEPDDAATIKESCAVNYGVSFPMTQKTTIKGPEISPLFQWLQHEGGCLSKPRWNFYKYIVGRDGHLAAWFSSITRPSSRRFRERVRRCLDN